MRFLPIFLLTLALISSLEADINTLKGITVEGDGKISLAIESSDPSVKSLARRAFGLHGAVVVTTPTDAAFTVRIERAGGGSAALLTVGSGQPYQEQLRRTVPGRDFNNAVLRACDIVIEATLRSKGFFAGRIAFVGKQRGVSEIYTSDLLFRQVSPLTQDRSLVTGPRWSPDGSRLLYTTYYKTGFPDIYSINLTTGKKTPIATFKGTNTGGIYSPDGRRIAMALSGTGNSEIYVTDSRGKNMRRLTTNKSLESSPSWSPDGTRLVYASDAPGRPQLYTISVNGGTPRRIPTNISSYCTEPAWNPVKPEKIAFTVSVAGGFQIAVYDFKTRKSKQVTKGASSVEPAWLRDGRHIIFTKREGGRTRLMIVDAETGKESELHKPGSSDASSASFVY